NGTNIGNITLPDDASYSLSAGSTAQVALNMEYLNSTDKQYTITYTSSDGSIFTVDSNGLITGVSKGTGTLSVRMKKSNGKVYSMTCRIDVT
ncbi:MAG: Ig-like domain-containing protein, partial [Pseudobutyrivibrio sp.]|nr:Ig-like domain-containing protein [Pseudobutyrivibrio sp.]